MISALLVFAAAVGSPCLHPSGPKISAADVAVSVPAFAALPPELVLGFSPQPGFTRVFTPGELNQWLSRRGVKSALTEPVCFAWDLRKPDPEKIRAAMLASLPEGSDVTVLETSQFGIPEGELQFLLPVRKPAAPMNLCCGKVMCAMRAVQSTISGRVRMFAFRLRELSQQRTLKPARRSRLRWSGSTVASSLRSHRRRWIILIQSSDESRGVSSRRACQSSSPPLNEPGPSTRAITFTLRSGAARTRILFDGVAGASGVQGQGVPVRMTDTGKLVQTRVLSAGQVILDLSPKEK